MILVGFQPIVKKGILITEKVIISGDKYKFFVYCFIPIPGNRTHNYNLDCWNLLKGPKNIYDKYYSILNAKPLALEEEEGRRK